MTHSLKPYPAYQDAGVPWLGDVPAHWKMKRAKWLFERMQRPVRPPDETVTCFRDGVVTLRKNRRTTGFTESLKEIGYQGVRRGDLVIHAMDAFAGAIGVSDSDGKCTPVYAVCQSTRPLNTHFYAYTVREMSRTQYIVALSRGIRQRSTDFRFETFADQELPVPPFDEQQTIAAFLTHIDRVTRRYIRAQQRLIELLKEQKRALIQQAVTRGLDPDVPLKESGIEWLGKIPEHWEVVRLKYLAHITTGNRDTIDRQENGKYPFFVRSQTVERINSYSFDGEAVLTAGDGAGVAKVFHYVNGRFDFHQRVYKFSKFQQVSGKFFFYYVKELLGDEVLKLSAKSTVESLRLPMLQNFPVAVPSLDEQQYVIGFVESKVATIDYAVKCTQSRIDLIREYRTRLIADVVTGKLDVRDVALPAAAPESQEEDDE